MTYKPLNISSNRTDENTASGAVQGVDLKSNPQLLDPSKALTLENYNIEADGRMVKREGRTDHITVSGQTSVYELGTLGDHDILGYGTNVASYYRPTGTLTVLKNDFPATGRFSAKRNGDYFYVTKGEGVYQIKFARGAELVTPAGWAIPVSTVTDGTVARYDAPSGTSIYMIDSDGFSASIDLSATAGDQFEFSVQMSNYTSVASAHTYIWNKIGGTFDDYTLAETQSKQTFVLTATSTDDMTLQTLVSYATTVGSFYVPTGTIDSSNKIFEINAYSTNLSVTVDGSPVTGWTLEGTTLTVAVAPTATIQVKNNPEIDSPVLETSVSIKKIDSTALEISQFSSERGSVLAIENGRMYLGNYPGDTGRVKYSSTGINLDVPAVSWTIGTLNNNAGEISSKLYGEVKDIKSLGSVIKIFYAQGETGTAIIQGDTNKTDQIYYNTTSSGLVGGLAETPFGLIVPNERGIWLKTTEVASNIPYSDSQEKISVKLPDFEDYDFTDAATIYYQPRNATFIACRRDSDINNYILVYFHDFNAWGYYSGWNVNSFTIKDGELYAGSAIEGKVYKLFDTNADSGSDIWTNMYQELSVGDLTTSKRLEKQWFSGMLSDSTEIKIHFDIFDRSGRFIEDKLILNWTLETGGSYLTGIGSPIGSPIGGTGVSGLTNSFLGGASEIADFQRIRVRFTENSVYPHEINWLRLETNEKDPIVTRILSTSSLPTSQALLTEDGEPIITEDGSTLIIE